MAPATDQTIGDTELLQRHIKGDPDAFALLLERYRRELLNFLTRFTGDAGLAEDVFQETFLQLHVSATTFDPSKRLKPWLFTIAANKARDAMRSRQRRQAAPLDATVAGSNDDRTSYASLMAANIPPPMESLVNQETRQAHSEHMHSSPVQGRDRYADALAVRPQAGTLAPLEHEPYPHRRQPAHQQPQVRSHRAEHQEKGKAGNPDDD